MLYKKVLKPILFCFDAEKIHHLFIYIGAFLGRSELLKRLTAAFYGYKGKDISKKVDDLTYKTPFILSAGFDYNAKLTNILPEVSFGGVEVGSVTAKPCPGNTIKPMMTRLPKSKSIIVSKGLRNDGVDAIIERLKKNGRQDSFIIGVSIARSNDRETSSIEAGIADYFYSFKKLNGENVGDYYTLNISCPNAFGGESFTEPKALELLLSKISLVKCDKPVYVKMPINLEWQKFDELLKVLEKFKMIKGVVIGNLNKDYDSLDFRDEAPKEYRGGLSGKPCFEPSNALIERTKKAYGGRFTIIGCGGVMSAEDMARKFKAGSDLVALITGMIYNGPGFIKELAESYSKSV